MAERLGIVDVGDRDLQLLGQVGTPSMMLEKVLWMWRVSASSSVESSTMSGSSWMRATR